MWWLGDRIPTGGGDPGTQCHAADETAERSLDHPMHPAHRCGIAVVPATRAADRGDRVDTKLQRRVAYHDGGPLGDPDRGAAAVAEPPGPFDGGGGVEHLEVTDRGSATRAAVTTEVKRHDTGAPAKDRGHPAHRRTP